MTFLFQFNNTLPAPWNHAQLNAFIAENANCVGMIYLPPNGISLLGIRNSKIKTFSGSSSNRGLKIIVWRLLHEGVECTQGIQNSVPISQLFRQYYGDLNPLRLEPRAATIFAKSISVDRTHMSRGYSEITATVNVLFCNTNIQYIKKACCGQNALHAFYALLSVD